MTTVEFDVSKQYNIDGIEVFSEVVKDEDTPTNRIFFLRTSCASQRWGTRTVGFSININKNPKLDNLASQITDTLERNRRKQAERLVKIESGELPEKNPNFFAIQLCGPTGKKINAIGSPDLSVAPNLFGKDLIELLELRPVRKDVFQTQLISVPLFAVTIKYGAQEIDTVVARSEHGSPACILGGDFFQKIMKGKENVIEELVVPDHQRALANAARCKKRHVLITGKYGAERPRHERIKNALAARNFIGLILDEYPDIEEQSLPEKMVTYASLSRFVIVDDFTPSGHISELEICRERNFVTAILRADGKPSTMMQATMSDDNPSMKEFTYRTDTELESVVQEAAKWADATVTERASRLNRKYAGWRGPNKMM